MKLNITFLGSAIRHALTIIAGLLFANADIAEADMQAISGGIATVIAVAWSMYNGKTAAGAQAQ